MNSAPMIALVVHITSGVFWAGSTFTMARTSGAGADRVFAAQMISAVLAIAAGGALWGMLHRGQVGVGETLLDVGALAALTALLVQAAVGGTALRALRRSDDRDEAARRRMVLAQRVAAALLLLTVVCMAAFRYA